jgi:uncharacterized membrane protein
MRGGVTLQAVITVKTVLIMILQWVHVLFAIFWFGSALYAWVVIWPEAQKLPDEPQANLMLSLRTGRARKLTVTVACGTVGLGFVRGIAGGVLDRLDSLYGLTFIASALVGIWMVCYVIFRGFGKPWLSWTFPTGFFVLFTLMIAMRFGY